MHGMERPIDVVTHQEGAAAWELAWSRKRLIDRFQTEIGVPPKTVARLIRFQHALRLIDGQTRPRWSEIVHACGYYDQSHLIRDFHQFAGCTPGELARRRMPGGAGFAG